MRKAMSSDHPKQSISAKAVRWTCDAFRLLFSTDYRFIQRFAPAIGIGGLICCAAVPTIEWYVWHMPVNALSLIIAILVLLPLPIFPRKRDYTKLHKIWWELSLGYVFAAYSTYNSLLSADHMPLGHEILQSAAFHSFLCKPYGFFIGYPALTLATGALFVHAHTEVSLQALGFYRGLSHAMFLGLVIGVARMTLEHYYIKLLDSQDHIVRLKVEKKVTALRLSSLKAKADPHFLFNTLNSIYTIHRISPDKTADAILSLSSLFRYILEAGDTASVTLARELSIVESYLRLEQLRFGDKLRYHISKNGSIDSVHIPALTIQALVENSVKHGISARSGEGSIAISVTCEGSEAVIRVEDDGPGFVNGAGISNDGHGLSVVKGRLGVHFKESHTFEIADSSLGGAMVEIRIPCNQAVSYAV